MTNQSEPRPHEGTRILRDAVWFPRSLEINKSIEKLTALVTDEYPIAVRVYPYAVIMLAIEEAIARRTSK